MERTIWMKDGYSGQPIELEDCVGDHIIPRSTGIESLWV